MISGNDNFGLQIFGPSGNVVLGNYIGTNRAGTSVLGNSFDGVVIDAGGSNNTIGGTSAGARNIIAGNNADGVILAGPNNLVQGNYIGTDATGTVVLSNAGAGVTILDSAGNTVGGTVAEARNLISGNGF